MKAGASTKLTEKCGCYYCLEVCNFKEVTEFVDDGQTALCPNCGIDSLVSGITSREALEVLSNRYFGDS